MSPVPIHFLAVTKLFDRSVVSNGHGLCGRMDRTGRFVGRTGRPLLSLRQQFIICEKLSKAMYKVKVVRVARSFAFKSMMREGEVKIKVCSERL